MLPVCVIDRLINRHRCVHHIVRTWGRVSLWLVGIRLEIEGSVVLEHAEPRLYVVNHPSALEVLWGAAVCPPRPLAIGKRELIFIPVINLVWWALGFAFVDRKNGQRAIKGLRKVVRRIGAESRTLLIAPEGTRSRDGRVGPFKKGAFHLAVQAQVPIHPVAVHGTFELMPRSAWLARSGVIRLRALPVVDARGKSADDIPAMLESVRGAIVRAHDELAARAKVRV